MPYMKNTFKYLLVLGMAAVGFSSCIEEEFPTDVVTNEMVAQSPAALEAMAAANNAWMTESRSVLDSHGDFGYPGICMGLDALTSDVACGPDFGYDAEFLRWRACSTLDADYNAPYFVWKFFYTLIKNANSILVTLDMENLTDQQKVFAGQSLAYRAMSYLHLARVFEYKGTWATDEDVDAFKGLTVVKVTEQTAEQDGANNPRVPRDEMYAFIESDLLTAVELLDGYDRAKKNEINQAVVYGMLARTYLEMERWADAEAAARKAINLSGAQLTTEAQWHNKITGFNDIATPSWMWGIMLTSDDRVVTTGVCNFVSFMSPEATYGYVGGTGWVSVKQIDARLYSSIPDTDWRKRSWIDPDRSKFTYELNLPAAYLNKLPSYTPLKFRPAEGEISDPLIGSAADFPLMRVEEMYLIEAEAAGMQDLARGKQLLTAFAQTRNAAFESVATDARRFQDECLFQRQIEFWGEGVVFFDHKRLNKPQMRGYVGTNHFEGSRYNSPSGNPSWTTLPIPTMEVQSNAAIKAQQNPQPSAYRGDEWVE